MPEKDAVNNDDTVLEAAAYRLMSAADTCFSRKNYNEAYIGYSSVLDSDPRCLKAVFRLNISSQYLMCETAAVYLSSDHFFRDINEMLTSALENNEDGKLILTVCRDMLDFILYNADYEKRFALSHKSEKSASEYIRNVLELLRNTLFIMNCIIRVNEKDSAFAAMKCSETGSEIYKRLCEGMEYYAYSGADSGDSGAHIWLRELYPAEKEKADNMIGNIRDIWSSILKKADDALYGELKNQERKNKEKTGDVQQDNTAFPTDEYENWRKRNEKQYISADSKSIIFGLVSKMSAVFAFVFAAMFVFESIVNDEVIGVFAASAVVFAALWIVFSSAEKYLDKKRKFYAKLVYGGAEQFQAEQDNADKITR